MQLIWSRQEIQVRNLMNSQSIYMTPAGIGSPFELTDVDAYRRWRDARVAALPASTEQLWTDIADLTALSSAEHRRILDCVRRTNMALYRALDPAQAGSKEAVARFGEQLGLVHLDHNLCADEEGLSSITVADKARANEYIPYTNRGINWHTDGYYNDPQHLIRGMILHCVHPAGEGGDNQLLDPELLYIYLRDREPAYIEALMHPAAMTIPANMEAGEEIRPERAGPVFSIDPRSGALHTRYTHRTRSIVWRDDALTREAVACLREFLDSGQDGIIRHRFAAGEGIICNNVLHNRASFTDTDQARLLFRARYYDRISDHPAGA